MNNPSLSGNKPWRVARRRSPAPGEADCLHGLKAGARIVLGAAKRAWCRGLRKKAVMPPRYGYLQNGWVDQNGGYGGRPETNSSRSQWRNGVLFPADLQQYPLGPKRRPERPEAAPRRSTRRLVWHQWASSDCTSEKSALIEGLLHAARWRLSSYPQGLTTFRLESVDAEGVGVWICRLPIKIEVVGLPPRGSGRHDEVGTP